MPVAPFWNKHTRVIANTATFNKVTHSMRYCGRWAVAGALGIPYPEFEDSLKIIRHAAPQNFPTLTAETMDLIRTGNDLLIALVAILMPKACVPERSRFSLPYRSTMLPIETPTELQHKSLQKEVRESAVARVRSFCYH